jgi:eukaryotic-like serine/threonine-protein kinase
MSGGDNQIPEDPKTVFAPLNPAVSAIPVPQPQLNQETSAPPLANSAETTPPEEVLMSSPPPSSAQIAVGDVLNGIYEVRSFIARGGMGEVYEGINVYNPDERVAIKVILPALAADPNVQAMFRKEATTLTRLSHPGLVTYRTLAQEPRLGALYIVTEFIDGTNLSEILGSVPRDPASLRTLARRLAGGLHAAHELGAVHRDVSPDNVILEGGDIARARIIDFGIAKDLDPSKATIIGTGFAGKLGFVAPEQLGDFDRNVGPWSDVYSLGLLLLAVARGRVVDMGATLVEAVDRRRAGVDVSEAPDSLRSLLAAMLEPNPEQRIRSMADVVAALDSGKAKIPSNFLSRRRPNSGAKPPVSILELARSKPLPFIGGGVAAVTLLGALLSFAGGKQEIAPVANTTATVALSPQENAEQVMNDLIPTLDCTWLDMEPVQVNDGAVTAAFRGVAGNSAAAQKMISDALTKARLKVAAISFENVSPAPLSVCALLDAYRPFKSRRGGDITSDQAKYERELQPDGSSNAGQVAAVPQIHLSADVMRGQFVLGGIDPDPVATAAVFVKSADELKTLFASNAGSLNPDGSATLKVAQTLDGLVGVLVIYGPQAIPADLIVPSPAMRTPDWQVKILTAARQEGWQADMVWFRIANELPETPTPSNAVSFSAPVYPTSSETESNAVPPLTGAEIAADRGYRP